MTYQIPAHIRARLVPYVYRSTTLRFPGIMTGYVDPMGGVTMHQQPTPCLERIPSMWTTVPS